MLDRSGLPAEVEPRGDRDVVVQHLLCTPDPVRARVARLDANRPGQWDEAALPAALQGPSCGREWHACVLRRYVAWRVPEAKSLHGRPAQGVVMSAGHIANILMPQHLDRFAAERQAVLRAGWPTTSSQHLDDTGARVSGVPHDGATLCHPYDWRVFTHRQHNSATGAGLWSVREEPAVRPGSPGPVSGAEAQRSPEPRPERAAAPKAGGDDGPMLSRDEAPQCRPQTDYQGRCWGHDARHDQQLQPCFAVHPPLVEACRTDMWADDDRLQAYAAAPTQALKQELSAAFDALCSRTTGYEALDQRIARTHQQKTAL